MWRWYKTLFSEATSHTCSGATMKSSRMHYNCDSVVVLYYFIIQKVMVKCFFFIRYCTLSEYISIITMQLVYSFATQLDIDTVSVIGYYMTTIMGSCTTNSLEFSRLYLQTIPCTSLNGSSPIWYRYDSSHSCPVWLCEVFPVLTEQQPFYGSAARYCADTVHRGRQQPLYGKL